MNPMLKWGTLLLTFLSGSALAAGGDLGQTVQQATNWTAIAMFVIFVGLTLGITKWAAGLTKSTSDFYTACLLYTSPSPRDGLLSRMPSSA